MAGAQMLNLPEEIWQRIAGCMTISEWATSGALSCKQLNRLQLPSLKLAIPLGAWGWDDFLAELNLTNVPEGPVLKSLQWACRHWKAASKLRIDLSSKSRKADVDSVKALFTDENVPKLVRQLILSVSAGYTRYNAKKSLVDLDLVPWLLSSIKTVEALLLDGYFSYPSLRHMTALKHLTLFNCYHDDDLLKLLPFGNLESLHFTGEPGSCPDDYPVADLPVRHNLKWLGLDYYKPGSLKLPSDCRVAVRAELTGDIMQRFERSWQRIGQQVYSLHWYDESRGGLNESRYLGAFPNLEQLAICGSSFLDSEDDEAIASDGFSIVAINLRLCRHLHKLTKLMISYNGGHATNFVLELSLPGYLPLRSLTVMVDRLHLRLESPRETASQLEKMIVGSFEPSLQINGTDIFELIDALASRGIAVGTAVAASDCATPYGNRRTCLYTKLAGTPPKRYEDLMEGAARWGSCFCGGCWHCTTDFF